MATSSSTSSSDTGALRDAPAARLAAALLAVAVTILAVEGAARHFQADTPIARGDDPAALVQKLPFTRIAGRELDNQMLVQNVALFARHPAPLDVDTAYVGTSRTKVLRPAWSGEPHAVNGSGNSYNEISYGLLLQAEILRLRFPNLRRVYFEASLLLRRPDRLTVAADHRKYLPLLRSLLPLRDQLPGATAFRNEVTRLDERGPEHHEFELVGQRTHMRLYRLLDPAPESIPVSEDPLLTQLSSSGERRAAPPPAVRTDQTRAEVARDNIKVQRLRNIPSWAPWDGLFDLIAIWGRAHQIEVVFFQPPVRSDLHRFQVEYGLAAHDADLQRVARQYGVPFIDLNRPGLRYMDDWSLFSDEDHMETCRGVRLLTAALHAGYREFRANGQVLPQIDLSHAAALVAAQDAPCVD